MMRGDALAREGAQILLAERDGEVLGIGALKEIGFGHGEIKSMHTSVAARRQGVARHILRGLIDLARDNGMTRLSLETGSADVFAASRTLYAREGFETCAPFADYTVDPLSVFMTKTLDGVSRDA